VSGHRSEGKRPASGGRNLAVERMEGCEGNLAHERTPTLMRLALLLSCVLVLASCSTPRRVQHSVAPPMLVPPTAGNNLCVYFENQTRRSASVDVYIDDRLTLTGEVASGRHSPMPPYFDMRLPAGAHTVRVVETTRGAATLSLAFIATAEATRVRVTYWGPSGAPRGEQVGRSLEVHMLDPGRDS